MKKTIIASAFALVSITSFANTSIPNVKGQIKVTANAIGGCEIEAQTINFGVLSSPLVAQQANASMNVKCSKQQPYSVAFKYGENTGSSSKNILMRAYTDSVDCIGSDGKTGRVWSVFETGGITDGSLSDVGYTTLSNTCYSDEQKNSYSDCHVIPSNKVLEQCVISYAVSKFGKMIGTANGDKIAYEVYLPESNNVWSSGSDVLTGIGTGDVENYNYTAKIVPASSSGLFPAPDTYIDTSIAELTF